MPIMEGDTIEEETLPFLMNYLPEYVIKKAEMELNETHENIVNGLQELKTLALEHKVTRDITFEDDFLVQFLRKRNYDTTRAFKQLVTMTKLRKKRSFLFQRIDLHKYFCYPSSKFYTILPRRCPDGCTIVLFELGKWNPEVFPVDECKTLGSTLFCQSIRDPMTQINGYKVIFDCLNVDLSQLRNFTFQNVYLFYHAALECIPGRYKELFVINNSVAMQFTLRIFRRCTPQKLRNRLFVKSRPEDHLEHFPPSVLPVQYGGELTKYHMTDWIKEANEEQAKFALGGQKNYY